jgi:hypothetical protein
MRKLAIVAATVLAAGAFASASAQTVTYMVDCARGQTITGAITGGDDRKPLVVNVRGTCNEFVAIRRDNVTLRGDPTASISAPSSEADLITIGANGVLLENLTLTGGRYGIVVDHAFRTNVSNCVMQDASMDGVRVLVGDVRIINNSTIQRAGANGLHVARAASANLVDSRILDSANAGIHANLNSEVAVARSTISGNGTGVQLGNGSQGTVNNTTISGNRGVGITVASSQASIGTNNVITNNATWGVRVFSGAMATIYGNRIEDNGWDGVSGDVGATLVMNDNQIRRNGAFGIACRMNCTMENQGDTLENNGAGGMLIEQGSKLRFTEDPTHASGGGWGLQCSDKESSVANVDLFDGTVSKHCTDFNN